MESQDENDALYNVQLLALLPVGSYRVVDEVAVTGMAECEIDC